MDAVFRAGQPLGSRPLTTKPGEEVVHVIVTRIADDQFPRTFFTRLDLDSGTDLFGQLFLETRDVAVGSLPAPGLGRRMNDGVDQPLGLAHGKRLVGDPLRGALLLPAVERRNG